MDNSMQPFAPQPSGRPSNIGMGPNPNQSSEPTNAQPQANAQAPTGLDPQIPPAMDQDQSNMNQSSMSQNQSGQNFAGPQPTASLDNSGKPALHNTGVNLESPILEPTHFDGMKNPNFQPGQPGGMPGGPQAIGSANINNSPLTPEQSKLKTFTTLTIVFGALAFIGIVLGIWSLISNIDTSKKLAAANDKISVAASIIGKIENDTGTTIATVNDIPEYNAVSGNIYITDWGIKFKIPDDLENVSYTLDQKFRPQICFTAHKAGIKILPAFADIDQNPNGLGCVTRVATYEGDSDKDTGISFGQKIFTDGEYSYYYKAPEGHFSQDAAEQGLEETATQIIKNMISNNISSYK